VGEGVLGSNDGLALAFGSALDVVPAALAEADLGSVLAYELNSSFDGHPSGLASYPDEGAFGWCLLCGAHLMPVLAGKLNATVVNRAGQNMACGRHEPYLKRKAEILVAVFFGSM
jgi:hypothetical protein